MNEVDKPVFAYLYDGRGRVVTLAYTIFRDEILGSLEEEYTAYVGYAICNPEDQHRKSRGRQIAQGRMENLDSRMAIPLGSLIKRSLRLEAIIEFVADWENTVDQYGGDLLSRTARTHREFGAFSLVFEDMLGSFSAFDARVGSSVVLDTETHPSMAFAAADAAYLAAHRQKN